MSKQEVQFAVLLPPYQAMIEICRGYYRNEFSGREAKQKFQQIRSK